VLAAVVVDAPDEPVLVAPDVPDGPDPPEPEVPVVPPEVVEAAAAVLPVSPEHEPEPAAVPADDVLDEPPEVLEPRWSLRASLR